MPVRGTDPAFQAYCLLVAGYAALPLIAGADKFTHYLTDWNQYLAPSMLRVLGGQVDAFMKTVGVIEMSAGILVAAKPRWGSFVVGVWLSGIIGNLLMFPGYYDVALRDFGLAVGAFSLWRLSRQYGD
ncbi:MAG: hypothetical protein HYZ75_12955 [Elusimicrobia bacterium]|nr:hypothetical protein [Elusimicrobiota bacterium]